MCCPGSAGCSSRARSGSSAVGLLPLSPGTEHIFVGAGDGPCVILMAGTRTPDEQLHYPVSELAARYGASADEETTDFEQA